VQAITRMDNIPNRVASNVGVTDSVSSLKKFLEHCLLYE
jgi:hypothetical protein